MRQLGRHLGVYDPPRHVLNAVPGVKVVEMERSKQDALCCGTSGFIHCDDASKRLQEERLQNAQATGSATLVTACPKCLIHFNCAQEDDRRRGEEPPSVNVTDFTLLAAWLLGYKRAEKVESAASLPASP